MTPHNGCWAVLSAVLLSTAGLGQHASADASSAGVLPPTMAAFLENKAREQAFVTDAVRALVLFRSFIIILLIVLLIYNSTVVYLLSLSKICVFVTDPSRTETNSLHEQVTPTLGSLRRMYSGLPTSCEVLIKVRIPLVHHASCIGIPFVSGEQLLCSLFTQPSKAPICQSVCTFEHVASCPVPCPTRGRIARCGAHMSKFNIYSASENHHNEIGPTVSSPTTIIVSSLCTCMY